MVTCSFFHLSLKISFLIAITSSRQMEELGMLMVDPLNTTFYKGKAIWCPYPHFVPKVSLEHNINHEIHLSVFYPKPQASRKESSLHSLDVKRALVFYLDRTKPFHAFTRLFAPIAYRMKGQLISTQWLSQVAFGCIKTCFENAEIHPLQGVTAPSTTAEFTSTALLKNVPIAEISATWSSAHTFAKHYAILPASKDYATFGDAVLRTVQVLNWADPPQHPPLLWFTAWGSPTVEHT